MGETIEGRIPCRFCAESIEPAAKVCPHCGREFARYDGRGRKKVTPAAAAFAIAVGLVIAIVVGIVISDRIKQRDERQAKERACEVMRSINGPGYECP